jgi:hypothetical protein
VLRGQDDLDAVYSFTLGEPNTLPLSVSPAVVGMRAGGIRRILVPPRYGWGANGTSRSLCVIKSSGSRERGSCSSWILETLEPFENPELVAPSLDPLPRQRVLSEAAR